MSLLIDVPGSGFIKHRIVQKNGSILIRIRNHDIQWIGMCTGIRFGNFKSFIRLLIFFILINCRVVLWIRLSFYGDPEPKKCYGTSS